MVTDRLKYEQPAILAFTLVIGADLLVKTSLEDGENEGLGGYEML